MPSYVVTGASRGIGLEFVRQLSAEADNVVFGLVRNKMGSKALLNLAATRENVHLVEADLSDHKSLQKAADEVGKLTSGTLDNLVNNAAFGQPERWKYTLDAYADGEEDHLEKDFFDNMNINVLGVIHTTNAFLPLLKASAAAGIVARVVTVSSALGDLDFVLASDYAGHPFHCISKAAVNMVVAKYAARMREENFVFLAIAPGCVDTLTYELDADAMRVLGNMVASFKKGAPQWDGKAITPAESVTFMLGAIAKTRREDSGAFISHLGTKQWL